MDIKHLPNLPESFKRMLPTGANYLLYKPNKYTDEYAYLLCIHKVICSCAFHKNEREWSIYLDETGTILKTEEHMPLDLHSTHTMIWVTDETRKSIGDVLCL